MDKFLVAIFLVCLCTGVLGDTPANCTHEDLIGTWNFYVSEGGHDRTLDCSSPGKVMYVISMTFSGMNSIVTNSDGAVGTFNLIYNQGFEAVVGYRKYFAFFEWKTVDANHSTYWCDRTMYGQSHDVLGNDWACFTAVKQQKHLSGMLFERQNWKGNVVRNPAGSYDEELLKQPYVIKKKFVNQINKEQKSWVAQAYPELGKMSYGDVLKRSGYGNGPITRPNLPRKLKFVSNYVKARLPEAWDWRNVNGKDYVSPIRNQGSCGSCYAFASMAMLEARIRIMTNNTQTPVFSTQEVVSCGKYSQGCDGGFPYLIAGKYAQDFGVVEEHCYPYVGKDTPSCKPAVANCKRTYAAKYEYVGGYYGACTEELMMQDLVANGPVAVGIEVYEDFQLYESGIYHHVTELRSPLDGAFNPFELTNHAVLVVGFGADSKTGEKYWIVKNSWGEAWGEKGYVRIRRGTDEIAIESLAVQSFPIPQLQ
ncbi:unnamed protein product [Clavelina lepadiformis]|uniref:Dipeptidyl peptidase 1 n=1 Tax=Clavelina lepadiformis TaxID=159417 RepID=A0ABP0GIC1_CLALP